MTERAVSHKVQCRTGVVMDKSRIRTFRQKEVKLLYDQ